MTVDPVRAIADAVLYEGYILWPYRRSALKNQRRFTFGGVYPPAQSRAHPDDPAAMQAEVLVEGGERTQLDLSVRFLQVVQRRVCRHVPNGLEPVPELTVDGQRHLPWQEAIEREVRSPRLLLGQARRVGVPVAVRAGSEPEQLRDRAGAPVGAFIRSWGRLRGELALEAQLLRKGVYRLRARLENQTPFTPGSREQALRCTFCSTHMLLRVRDGAFVSLTDPPQRLDDAAQACHNVGVWPVLVGEPGDRSTLLCSPIILEDHPRIAPESPGDLFDGGEIDQLLILNILSLTDEEKAEMRASDPRAAAILDRTEALTPEQMMRLHGTIREFGMARGA